MKVSREAKQVLRRKPATQFGALSKKTCHKRKKIKIIFTVDYIFIDQKVWSGQCVSADVFFGVVGEAGGFVEVLGTLRKDVKTKMVKDWPNFKATVMSNYSPKFRLLFTILNV